MNKVSAIVFLSNYLSHHQKPFCDAMYSLLGDGFKFIATESISDERIKLGYSICNAPYLIEHKNAISKRESFRLIKEADVVILGSAQEKYIVKRKREGKLIFRYSERPLKRGFEPIKYIPRYIKWHYLNPIDKPIYMLCASSYTASDYAKFGLFHNKCFKWGYFPECKRYEDVRSLVASKKKNSLLWCGRFIDWKHPEDAISIAKRLKADGYDFSLNFIGAGDLEAKLSKMIIDEGLSNNVKILGSMSPEKVREYMEQSEIFLFTSDRREGWGAVLNESMNSACTVIANKDIGSAPFLINDGENGMLYSSSDINDLCEKVKSLLDSPSKRADMGVRAYYTICNEWSPEIAASRLVDLVNSGFKSTYDDGPCSKAK